MMREKEMDVRSWMQERVEIYCDADRRGKADPEEAKKYCPTVGEAMDAWAGA